jgi:N-acetyl-anhydromuramyl-L-alanine amidase AmpD
MFYPNAEKRLLTVNHTTGGNTPRLMIMHIMEGTLAGTDAWFHNPASRVSAHFGIGRDGKIVQWVDTNDQAWHAAAANSYSIGVEHEGVSGNPLTDPQLDADAELLSWLHEVYPSVDLWINTRPFTGHGLSWHGLGGIKWGNHPDCPGAPVVHQLGDIVHGATNLP